MLYEQMVATASAQTCSLLTAQSARALEAPAVFILWVEAYPEDGGSKFLHNISNSLPDSTVSHPGR
jgi:hypothetical protein